MVLNVTKQNNQVIQNNSELIQNAVHFSSSSHISSQSVLDETKRILREISGLKSKQKGDDFEELMVMILNNEFNELMHWRGDKICLDDAGNPIYPRSSKWPDLEFTEVNQTHQRTYTYAIECKWRSSWKHNDNGRFVEYTSYKKLEDYFEYRNLFGYRVDVFIALGVGGSPNQPAELYIFRLDERWMFRHKKYPHRFFEQDLEKFGDNILIFNFDQKLYYHPLNGGRFGTTPWNSNSFSFTAEVFDYNDDEITT